jgi:hypothetical protein
MLKKALVAIVLAAAAFTASAASVQVYNKYVIIQFNTGKVFSKDYSGQCSGWLGVSASSRSVNGVTTEVARVFCNGSLIETINDR